MNSQRLPLPSVLLSQQQLREEGISFLPPDVLAPVELPVSNEGVTFDMAQAIGWIDGDHFAVGRWDGSLTVFQFSKAQTRGPLIAVAASTPSSEGVQIITWLAECIFATSNDTGSISIWRPNQPWDRLELLATLTYDEKFGAANSGDSFALNGELHLVVGHANGFVTVWKANSTPETLQLIEEIDVRSDNPVNPWKMHNVRGLNLVANTTDTGYVVTGSEDGDLCVVRIPDGTVLSRTVYNPNAKRGINAVAAHGRDILVANCSVGEEDNNLWYFELCLDTWKLLPRHQANLRTNPDSAAVFNFAVVWGEYEKGRCFFSSTEEGALWMGTVTEEKKLNLVGYKSVTAPLGAALAYSNNGNLAFVAYDLHEFHTFPPKTEVPEANPHRLMSTAID